MNNLLVLLLHLLPAPLVFARPGCLVHKNPVTFMTKSLFGTVTYLLPSEVFGLLGLWVGGLHTTYLGMTCYYGRICPHRRGRFMHELRVFTAFAGQAGGHNATGGEIKAVIRRTAGV
ncbi:predicted protein [Pyrenophora tritici-repentis Pt-1C-BFP]|uniref:Uncharacterized protein n=1 Tax=Pyrenophora tritici-repentis (strain Pt-1C-BFP) TaxID=426418 RepID=B2WFH1_PYRTR|nr:uncharacterized protein PTRG_09239 [Pyrenophora tritici-repentis Pt-1C-BFP]EDU42290.1 predicted protein [Pyrenophora tritici-repentis Pt-1C-BFP]